MTTDQWTLSVWAFLGLVVAGGVAWSVLSGGRVPGPGALVRWITSRSAGRVVLVVGWMWLGWHLFAR